MWNNIWESDSEVQEVKTNCKPGPGPGHKPKPCDDIKVSIDIDIDTKKGHGSKPKYDAADAESDYEEDNEKEYEKEYGGPDYGKRKDCSKVVKFRCGVDKEVEVRVAIKINDHDPKKC